MEFTHGIIKAGLQDVGGKLSVEGRFVQSAEELLSYDYTEMNRLLSSFLDAMAKEYAAGNGYSFPVYFDTTGGSMYAYGITGIPVTLFIDSDGNLVTQHVGAIDEDTLVRNIKSLGIDVQQ